MPDDSPDQIRRVVAEVYARPEFGPERAEQPTNWFYELIHAFFTWLASLHAAAPFLFWVILVGCLLLLLGLIVYVGWTTRHVFGMSRRVAAERKAAQLRQRLSLGYWAEAQARAAAGEFTEAIRYLFLSLVYRFDEEGRISFQQAYTNHEYLGLFTDRPAVREPLNVFVTTLDDFWYGQRSTDRGHYDQCLTLYQQLTQA